MGVFLWIVKRLWKVHQKRRRSLAGVHVLYAQLVVAKAAGRLLCALSNWPKSAMRI